MKDITETESTLPPAIQAKTGDLQLDLSALERKAVQALKAGPHFSTRRIPNSVPDEALWALSADGEVIHVGRTTGAREHVMGCAHRFWGHLHPKIMRKILNKYPTYHGGPYGEKDLKTNPRYEKLRSQIRERLRERATVSFYEVKGIPAQRLSVAAVSDALGCTYNIPR